MNEKYYQMKNRGWEIWNYVVEVYAKLAWKPSGNENGES